MKQAVWLSWWIRSDRRSSTSISPSTTRAFRSLLRFGRSSAKGQSRREQLGRMVTGAAQGVKSVRAKVLSFDMSAVAPLLPLLAAAVALRRDLRLADFP